MEKMTYVSCINDVLNGVALTDEHKAKLTALIGRLEKSATKSDKPTKAQLANEQLQMDIYNSMATDHKYSVGEMIKFFSVLNGLSTQKVTPQLTALCGRGLISRIEEKGKSYYLKVVAE